MAPQQKNYAPAPRDCWSQVSVDAELVGVDLEATEKPPSQ